MSPWKQQKRLFLAALPLCIAATLALNWVGSQFEPTERVLAQKSWGAGTPSSSYITAFATGRPWWTRYTPEAVVVNEPAGIVGVVRVPREAVRSTGEPLLPSRSVGYFGLLGGFTALRSLFSDNLIYDYRSMLIFQRLILFLGLGLVPIVLYRAHAAFRSPWALAAFAGAWLPVLFLWPNRRRYLPDGIIDSAIASGLALLGLCALIVIARHCALHSRTGAVWVAISATFLSFCSMVRGEFVLVYAFTLAWLSLLAWRRRGAWRGLLLSWCLLALFPVANGLINKSVFGHFVPLRLQSGQNLYEPIGQYPNPYGIRYDDVWMGSYLAQFDLPYLGFETDKFLTRRYLAVVRESPGLLWNNFRERLRFFSREFGIWLDLKAIVALLGLASLLAWRDRRFEYVALPMVLAMGYLLIFGWLNNLLRLVVPAHFLINVFLCATAAYLVAALRRVPDEERDAGGARRL